MEVPPDFKLFGEADASIDESIQPALPLRGWGALSVAEKRTIIQQLTNLGWLRDTSSEILETIEHLNQTFLRLCPGKNLHGVGPDLDNYGDRNRAARERAAYKDYVDILLNEKSEPLVLRMLSKHASCYIDRQSLKLAANATDATKRKRQMEGVFYKFDSLAVCLNHIFEQFSINLRLTRAALIPMQDEKIAAEIYAPTLLALSDPRWKAVNADLVKMFQDYGDGNYSESITKAHAAVQRFLQILVGENGANSRGEVGKLFAKAKTEQLIPANRFSEQFINAVQGAIVAERATNSTAKPANKAATATDALLVMNLVMVFLQHCLAR